ncbi:SLATT domain-containing protein [Amphritea sp.]|uniref:SLATT domain-containing protein n=1 Tax=Amphritea sp. TaxID=1872502 RepID=UPI003A8FCAB2
MGWAWIRRLRPEDPQRLGNFRQTTQDLKWDEEDVAESLAILFNAVDLLAEAEVAYYYRRRGTRAWISGVTRFGGWLFGSIGLLLPLLATTTDSTFQQWAAFGYVALAIAASCFAANSLFGGTAGHIRFVATQLELEKLMTATRISWCRYLSQDHADDISNVGFSLILNYAEELYAITLSETGLWGELLLKELSAYQQDMTTHKADSPQ